MFPSCSHFYFNQQTQQAQFIVAPCPLIHIKSLLRHCDQHSNVAASQENVWKCNTIHETKRSGPNGWFLASSRCSLWSFSTGYSSSLPQVVMAHTRHNFFIAREREKKRCGVNDLSALVHVYVWENGCETKHLPHTYRSETTHWW